MHVGLRHKYFCGQPWTSGGSLLDSGGAVIYRVAEAGYLDGSSKEVNEKWQEKCLYIPDVTLEDLLGLS